MIEIYKFDEIKKSIFFFARSVVVIRSRIFILIYENDIFVSFFLIHLFSIIKYPIFR